MRRGRVRSLSYVIIVSAVFLALPPGSSHAQPHPLDPGDRARGDGLSAQMSSGEKSFAASLTLKQGSRATFPGTDVKIEVKEVNDFTSKGCLGGPLGCPDQVRLGVSRGSQTQEVVLRRVQTPAQRTEGVDQARIFGYRI